MYTIKAEVKGMAENQNLSAYIGAACSKSPGCSGTHQGYGLSEYQMKPGETLALWLICLDDNTTTLQFSATNGGP